MSKLMNKETNVKVKEIDIKQHSSTTLLTPKKPNLIITNQTSQSDNKQLNLRKDLFRNKTFNSISYTPGNKAIHPKHHHQSPFSKPNTIVGCRSTSGVGGSVGVSEGVGNGVGVLPSSKSISNSVKNSNSKTINYMSSIPPKKQRPPLFVIQEKKIENQLTTNANGVTNGHSHSNSESNSKEKKKLLPHGANCNYNSNNISSSLKTIQMRKISFPSELSSKHLKENNNKLNKNSTNRRNQNNLTVRTCTMPSNFKPKRESLSQAKSSTKKDLCTGSGSGYLDKKPKKIPQRSLHIKSILNNSTKKAFCAPNSIRCKDNTKIKTDSKTTSKCNMSNNRKNYFSLNGSCDNNSFSNNNPKLKSPSNKIIRHTIPVVHFYTNEYVLLSYAKILTQREVNELKQFNDTIYFIGKLPYRKSIKKFESNDLMKSLIISPTNKITNNDTQSLLVNNSKSTSNLITQCTLKSDEAYEDKESDYNLIIGDHINYRYEIIQLLGKGSFGEAVKCLDHKINDYVCIKLIKSHQRFQSQALIEIKLLEHIKSNDLDNESNIVKYYSNFIFRNHKCIVFELLDLNLFEYIKSRDYLGLELKKIKEYTIQLLFTLLFLKRNKILHCDLKPENILLSRFNKSIIKTIDFGSSCFDTEKLYCYIQSRFYRAPEIILDQGYGIEIDMWSLGCIIAELFTGIPIFPGEDERDQLNYMMEYLDIPSSDFIEMSRKREMFFDEDMLPYKIPNSKGKIRLPRTKTFSSFLFGSDELFQDFIKRCLRWDPEKRMTPEEGLMHPWIIREMNSESMLNHKQKIKRIKSGLSKLEQKNELSRISLKQKSNSTLNNNNHRNSAKKKTQGSRFKVQGNTPSSSYNSNYNSNPNTHSSSNNTNSNKSNNKPLSTKHSTTGKLYVSLSLEDNTTGNINANANNKTNQNHQQEKIIEIKLNDIEHTSKVSQQKFSFIDLDADEVI